MKTETIWVSKAQGVLALEMAYRRTDNPTVKRVISKLAKEVMNTRKENDHFELEVRVRSKERKKC